MENKSSVNKLCFYASNKGWDYLYKDFKNILNAYYRDQSKEYDETEKVIYLFPGVYDEQNTHMGFDFQKESEPYSFVDHVKSEVNPALSSYLFWINKIFETESAEKFKAIVNSHREKMKNCLSKSDQKDKLPGIAIKRCLKEIEKLESYYVNTASPDINKWINEFVAEFSKKTTYPANVIQIYLQAWENHQGRSYPRSIAKDSIEELIDTMPSDDTLRNWEEKWTHYYSSRTEK